MKTFSMLTAVLALGCTLVLGDAEAASKRFGGGQSTGMQRQSTMPDKAAVAPTQATGAVQAAQPKRSWMGPLAGLAAGLGLAALASHFGFGEELASMLMIGLLVMAVLVVIGLVMRRRAAAREPAGGGLQYAAAGASGVPAGGHALSLPDAGGSSAPAAVAGHIPADFDLAGFVRNAKVSFIRLQAANDAGNLDDIRAFTTSEMFAEISLHIRERGHAKQETDVVSVEAVVLDVAEEPDRYIVSTRFNGLIREDPNAAAEPFDEIWHLVKPRDGHSGWVVAGIQQTQTH